MCCVCFGSHGIWTGSVRSNLLLPTLYPVLPTSLSGQAAFQLTSVRSYKRHHGSVDKMTAESVPKTATDTGASCCFLWSRNCPWLPKGFQIITVIMCVSDLYKPSLKKADPYECYGSSSLLILVLICLTIPSTPVHSCRVPAPWKRGIQRSME